MARAVDQATDELRRAILGGGYAPGDRLPPERRLAEQVGVSRLTLRSALSKLEGEGLIQARQGSGITVLDYRTHAGVELLPHLLETGDLALLRPILQLRRAVAVEAVATACERATADDLDRLRALADALGDETDPEALAEGNLVFGRTLIQITDNLPLELLFNTVAQVYRARPDLSGALLDDADAVRASFGLIADLVARGDPDTARTVVRQALEAIDAATLDAMEAP